MSPVAFLAEAAALAASDFATIGRRSAAGRISPSTCACDKITPEQRENLDLSSWTLAFNGAEPVREETIEQFCRSVRPCGFRREAFYPCYGMAEATLIVSRRVQVTAAGGPHVRRARRWNGNQVVDALSDEEGARLAGGLRRHAFGSADSHRQSGNDDSLRRRRSRRGLGRRAERRSRILEAAGRDCPYVPRPSGRRQRPVSAHRRSGIHARRRAVCHRPAERSDHRPRLEPLSARHRAHGRAAAIRFCAAEPARRSRPKSSGRERLVVVYEVERGRHREVENFAEIFDAIRRHVAAEHELAVEAIVLFKAGSIPKNLQRKNPAPRLPQRFSPRHARSRRAMASLGCCRRQAKRRPMQRVAADRSGAGRRSSPARWATKTPTAIEPFCRRRQAALANRREPTARTAEGETVAESTVEIVLQHVRLIAKERAGDLTLDTNILDLGLDSLERMEIIAALGRYVRRPISRIGAAADGNLPRGGRSGRSLLGQNAEARVRHAQPAKTLPPEHYRFELFPEYQALRQNMRSVQETGLANPYFRRISV